ncbi:hypothetical protein ACDP63_10415 [Paracoccus sp. P2]|uniref:Uncharacterized protein n=1 Tax=Paracoccus pantotrophus TaxID=82367 RepID=A0A1I5B793_PARPN|nr:hypothetical protein [Paracoccus pantotrophus]RQP03911.1 MAG: hypothetical protein D1H97_20740 [Paracoccus sp. BP8]MDF3852837.1 hypothetical protein [Paracoccus pantotrophus]QFG36780.1 hypothetical protein ESD82_11280 [Paracoccus pantotrophus]QLH14344.1 hypothetical protein HYQ43_08415 [Paracoccus pantotrophus]RDD96219.1 hypothetical protein DTW92_13845 [Paracoccus pantotrophus]
MRSLLAPALLAATFVGTGAQAQDFGYEAFEPSVNHIDLETCPARVTAEKVFCRATLLHDTVYVYVFEDRNEMKFVEMLAFEAGEYEITFK